MDMGAVYFKICFWQLDFKVVNDRAVLLATMLSESLFSEKPEASSKLIFLILALRLSLLNAFIEILALILRMSICLALNFPGVVAAFFTS